MKKLVARREAREHPHRFLHERVGDRLLVEPCVVRELLGRLDPGEQLLRGLPDDVVLRLRDHVLAQRVVRDRLDEEDDAPDVVDREAVAEVLHPRSRPAAQDPVVEVARPGVAAAARVVLVGEVGGGGDMNFAPGPLPSPCEPVAADAALEEDLLAAQQVLPRSPAADCRRASSRGRSGRGSAPPRAGPSAACASVPSTICLCAPWKPVGAAGSPGSRHDVLRVQLPRVAEQAGLAAAHLTKRSAARPACRRRATSSAASATAGRRSAGRRSARAASRPDASPPPARGRGRCARCRAGWATGRCRRSRRAARPSGRGSRGRGARPAAASSRSGRRSSRSARRGCGRRAPGSRAAPSPPTPAGRRCGSAARRRSRRR